MPKHKKLRYVLTFVDTFTGWFEAFSTSKETADIVAQAILEHIISRFGLPCTIQLDNVLAFISKVIRLVSDTLQISWKLHVPYRPQSSDKVERANGLIKDHLTKLSLELRLSWPALLPLALIGLRASPRSPSGLSPCELLYGRSFLINHDLLVQIPPLPGTSPTFPSSTVSSALMRYLGIYRALLPVTKTHTSRSPQAIGYI